MKASYSKLSTRYILIIVVIATIFFMFSGFIFTSSLNDISTLSTELASSPETIYNYNLSERPPFKYRFLFSSLIKLSYSAFSEPQNSENFYIVYIFWSALSYIAAALSFYFLLRTLNFSDKFSFGGVLLFLISPAVLSAYTLPVHSREDFLAYTILNFGIIFIIKRNFIGILLASILGVLCRETLLIIPFLYIIAIKGHLMKKILVLSVCLLIFTLIRVILGYSSYNLLGLGFLYNLENIEESVGFVFLVFGFMWPIFLFDIFVYFKQGKKFPDEALTIIRKTSFIALFLIFSTTLIGGRINEIRLLFLLFPWVIPIFLFYFNMFSLKIRRTFRIFKFRVYVVAIAGIIIPIYHFATENIYLFVDGIYDVPYNHWIAITCIQLFVFFSILPIYYEVAKSSSNYQLRSLVCINQ